MRQRTQPMLDDSDSAASMSDFVITCVDGEALTSPDDDALDALDVLDDGELDLYVDDLA